MLEPELLLAGKYSVYPAFLIGAGGIECRKRLGKSPEFAVSPDAIFNDEAFECLSASSGEQNHSLMHTVERGLANPSHSLLAPSCFRVFRLCQLRKHVDLYRFLFPGNHPSWFFLTFAKKMLGSC